MPDSFPNQALRQAKRAPTAEPKAPTMPARRFAIQSCARTCSLNVAKFTPRVAAMVHSWFEQGFNNYDIAAKAAVLDYKLSHGAISRHRANHLVVVDEFEDITETSETDTAKMSDIDVLERIIKSGSRQLAQHGAKISPEMTMRAMELKYKLTQGSVLGDFMSAIAATMEDPAALGAENPSAAASADEQGQVGEDAAEPDAG